jgi:hypothetical protein
MQQPLKPKANPLCTTTIEMIDEVQKQQCMVIDIRNHGTRSTSPNKRQSTSNAARQQQLTKELVSKADSSMKLGQKRKLSKPPS